jgi:hypothetical protein
VNGLPRRFLARSLLHACAYCGRHIDDESEHFFQILHSSSAATAIEHPGVSCDLRFCSGLAGSDGLYVDWWSRRVERHDREWGNDVVPRQRSEQPNADVRIDSGDAFNSVVNLSGDYSVGELSIELGDTLSLGRSFSEAASLTVHDRITNHGRVEVGSLNRYVAAAMLIDGSVTFEGSGTLRLDHFSSVSGRSGSILTNAQGHTIQGLRGDYGSEESNNLGGDAISIINHGVIGASPDGHLLINPADGANGFENSTTGVLDAGGGFLYLVDGIFVNHGVIQAPTGSVTLAGAAEIMGGTLRSTPGSGSINLANCVLTNVKTEGVFALFAGFTATLKGTIDNSARFRTDVLQGPARFNIDGAVSLTGQGSIELSTGTVIGGSLGSTLMNAAGHTIRGVDAVNSFPRGIGQRDFDPQ